MAAKTSKTTPTPAAPASLSETAKRAAEIHHLMNTQMAGNALASVLGNLQDAIATMRRFLDDAERALETYKDQPSNAVQTVAHQIAWGNANATNLIEAATRETVTYSVCQANLAAADADPLEQIARFATRLDESHRCLVMSAVQEITDRRNGKA